MNIKFFRNNFLCEVLPTPVLSLASSPTLIVKKRKICQFRSAIFILCVGQKNTKIRDVMNKGGEAIYDILIVTHRIHLKAQYT